MFTLLQQYEIEHGHVHVPYRTKYQSESLGRWITLIRRYKRQNQLSSKWVDKFTSQSFIDESLTRKTIDGGRQAFSQVSEAYIYIILTVLIL